jgi:hypothetical protein
LDVTVLQPETDEETVSLNHVVLVRGPVEIFAEEPAGIHGPVFDGPDSHTYVNGPTPFVTLEVKIKDPPEQIVVPPEIDTAGSGLTFTVTD